MVFNIDEASENEEDEYKEINIQIVDERDDLFGS